jgi:hypothetical protein
VLTKKSYPKWLKKLLPFKSFYNDWLDISGMVNASGVDHKVNLDVSFFESLKFDNDSLKSYRIDAAKLCSQMLGSKPALCLSGGVDSQAMILAWKEAGLNFDTYILQFKNDLNSQDTDHAIHFCKVNSVPYYTIDFDVVTFLSRDNYDLGIKYRSGSPHFNVHYKLVEILKYKGHTGVCFGGLTPTKNFNEWGKNFDKNAFHYTAIQDIFDIPVQGSFLSFYPQLSWATTLLTPSFDEVHELDNSRTAQEFLSLIDKRYPLKVQGYKNVGFNVMAQKTKYTGFELVKKYFENITGDGWSFEKRFRHPLSKLFNTDFHTYKFNLTPEQDAILNSIYFNNFGSSH